MKLKRTMAGFLSAVVGFSSLGLSALAPASVSAANPWDGAAETSILEKKRVSSDESLLQEDGNNPGKYTWGYLQTNSDSKSLRVNT